MANNANLILAVKAPQSDLIPALLAATYVERSKPDATLSINFDDVNAVRSGGGAAVELTNVPDGTAAGGEQVLRKLLQIHPELKSRNDAAVRGFMNNTVLRLK